MGVWSIAKDEIENGEDPETAARCEFLERARLKINPSQLLFLEILSSLIQPTSSRHANRFIDLT